MHLTAKILSTKSCNVKKGWEEMHVGADLKVPKIFKFILKYVTPVYMLVVLGAWTYQEAIAKFLMKGEEKSRHPYLWGVRAMFVCLILLTVLMVWLAWRKKKNHPQGE
jgi:SNF family Na+-dependent transporter